MARLAEIADALQVADDAGQVVDVVAVALGAFLQVALVDVAAIVADGIGHVESEVVAAFAGSHAQQLAILLLGQVFLKVAVQGRAASEVLDVLLAVQTELVEDVGVLVFHDVEIAVVAVAVHLVAVFLVPLGVFHANVLGGNHLAVEHQAVFLRVIFLVVFFDEPQNLLHKGFVLRVIRNLDFEELGGFHEAVHADGEVLATQIDVARVEQRQHAFLLQFLQVLVVANLHFVAKVNDFFEESEVVHVVARGVLDAAVEVDGEHALGTR